MEVTLKNVGKKYIKQKRSVNVLENFSYKFKSGNLYVLKGESGTGKTTLLSLIALLQDLSEGEIFFNNDLVSKYSTRKKNNLRRDYLSIVFQDYNLFNKLSVTENVILMQVCENKIPKKKATKLADDILSRLGIAHRKTHYPYELSGGEQQRVGIARAIINNPEILICDEPISNLDAKNSEEIVEFINEYCHVSKKIVIVANHGTQFDKYADSIIKM